MRLNRFTYYLAAVSVLLPGCDSGPDLVQPPTPELSPPSFVVLYDSAVAAAGWTGEEHRIAMLDVMDDAKAQLAAGTAKATSLTEAAYDACVATAARRTADPSMCADVYAYIAAGGGGTIVSLGAVSGTALPGDDGGAPFGWQWDYLLAIEQAAEWMDPANLDRYITDVETAAMYNEGYTSSLPVFAVGSLTRSSA